MIKKIFMLLVAIGIACLIFVLFKYSKINEKGNAKVGVYQLGSVDLIDRGLFMYEYEKDYRSMMVSYLKLRPDSTFVMGTCNNQVWLAGEFSTRDQELILSNIYDFKADSSVNDRILAVSNGGRFIHFNSKTDQTSGFYKGYWYDEHVSVLQLGATGHHYGYLRNENVSLDSLKMFNKFWPWEKQKVYCDSVKVAKGL
jgi:hypothetical protein